MNKRKILKNGLILTVCSSAILATAATIITLPQSNANSNLTTTLNDTSVQAIAPTAISVRTDFPNTTYVHKFMNTVVIDGRVNQPELLKYINIDGLASRTSISIKQTSINYVTGEISFIVTLDKYYNSSLELIAEDFNSANLTLGLLARPTITSITTKTSYPATRVDRVIASFAERNTGGLITNLSELEKYADVAGVPSDGVLSINTAPVIDELAGTLSFTVTSSTFYGADYEHNSTPKDFLIALNTLTPKFIPTTVVALPTIVDKIPVNEFMPKAVVNNKIDMIFLQKFVKFTSVPPSAAISLFVKTVNNKAGVIVFDVQLSEYYNADNNLVTTSQKFNISLTLSPAALPTQVSLLPSYPETITPTLLAQKVGTAPNVNLTELSKYIKIDNLPPTAKISKIVYGQQQNRKFSLTLQLSQYYDQNAKIATSGVFVVTVHNRVNKITTDVKPLTTFPSDTIASNFFNLINPITPGTSTRAINQSELAHFVDLSTVPPTAIISIDPNNGSFMDAKTGEVGFRLIVSEHYNAKNELVASPIKYDISLKLLPQIANTSIKAKQTYSKELPWIDVMSYITVNNKIDYARLNEFLDLSLVPSTANLSLENVVDNGKGVTTFDFVTDKWYYNNNVVDGKYVEYAMQLELAPGKPSYNWLWITLASVAGIAIIVVLAIVLQKKRDKKTFIY